jgi:hypothetical protein
MYNNAFYQEPKTGSSNIEIINEIAPFIRLNEVEFSRKNIFVVFVFNLRFVNGNEKKNFPKKRRKNEN